MRKALSLLFSVFTFFAFGQNDIVLLSESFETDGNGSRYSVTGACNNCSGGYVFDRINNSPSCFAGTSFSNKDGSYLFTAQDNDATSGGCGTGGTVTFSVIDVQSYTNLRIRARYGATNGTSHTSDDRIRVQQRDQGGTWSNVVQFFGWDGNFSRTANENGQQNGTALSQNLREFTHAVPDPASGNLETRFYMMADANSELGVDKFEVIGDCKYPMLSISTTAPGGATNFCANEEIYLVAQDDDGTIEWFLDGAAIPDSDNDSILVEASGEYKVVYHDRACQNEATINIVYKKAPPVSSLSLSSPNTFCSNRGQDITADSTAPFYQWYHDGNLLSGETNQTLDATQYGTGEYFVLLHNNEPCTTKSDVVNITMKDFNTPVVNLDGPASFCEGTNRTLTSTPGGSYQWFLNGNQIQGATGQSILVSYPDSGNYQVFVSDPNGCSDFSEDLIITTRKAPQDPSISATGSTIKCFGDSVKLTSSFADGGYQWLLNGVELNGETNQVHYAKLDGDYQVRVSSSEDCEKTSSNFNVTIYDLPAKPTLSHSDTVDICRGEQVTLVSSQADGYQWFFNGNPISGANFRSYFTNNEGSFHVEITDANGCKNTSETVYVRTNIDDQAEITTVDSTTFCPGDEAILVSNYDRGNEWFYNGSKVIGVNTVEFAARDVGTYFAVVNINGCTDTSNSITVSHFQRPTPPSISPRDTAVCDGSNVTFTASGVSNYQWYFNNELIQGATNPSYTATTSGLYACETVDNNGCTNRDTVRFTKFFEEPATVSPGDTTICEDDNIVLSSNYEVGNQWYFNGNPIAGATDQTYQTATPGNYYVVVQIDNCVDQSNTMKLSTKFKQNQPTATRIGPDLFCPGDSSLIQSSNAVTYEWLLNGVPVSGANKKNFYAKEAGSYQVVAGNQFGCKDTSFIVSIFTYPQPILTSIDIINPSCGGKADGSISASAAGGEQPFQFYLDNGTPQASGNFNNLLPGDYMLYLVDNNGCMDSAEIVLDETPTTLSIIGVGFDVSCYQGNDGQIALQADGGQPNYEFSINGVDYTTETLFENLTAGKYVGYVRDNLGCIATTDSIEITEPEELFITALEDDKISCAGETDASISAAALGGTPGYFFSIDGGANFQSSGLFTDLAPGTYEVLVEDLLGCQEVSDPIIIEEPDTLEFSFAQVVRHVDCFGEETGMISGTAIGGTTPYEYSIDGVNYAPSGLIASLPAGEYQMYVRDAHACIALSDTLIIETGDSLGIMANVGSHVSCYGEETGTLLVQGSGGTGPLEYAIDLVNYQSSGFFQDLPAGLYDNITVRDSLGCVIFAEPIEITQPDLFELQLDSAFNISCNGLQDGKIFLSSIGGAGGNQFSIDGGNTFVTDSVFTGLSAGTYNLVVKDQGGCEAAYADPVIIEEPEVFELDTITMTHVVCNGLSTGVIRVQVTGGTEPYSYSVDGGQTFTEGNPIINSLPAGTYDVVIKDAGSCVINAGLYEILEPDVLVASNTLTKPISCFGIADAEVSLSAVGGNGGYSYSIDGGQTFQGSPVFTGLGSGVYQFIVKDNLDCQATTSIQINEPNAIQVTSLQVIPISCNGANDGKILANSTGGRGIRSYSIDGGTTYQTNGIFNDLGPNTYNLIIRDTAGCELGPIEITLDEPDVLSANLVIQQQIVCAGSPDGILETQVTGGTAPYQFSINGAPAVTDSIFEDLNPGNYVVTVEDANGCVTQSNLVNLQGASQISNVASVVQQMSCFGANDGAIQTNASGGSGNFTYSLDGNNFGPSSFFSNLAPGTYHVFVKDTAGCVKKSNPVEILNKNELSINATVDKHVNCFGGSDAQITAYAVGGTNKFTYQLNAGIPQSLPVFQNLSAGQYFVKVIDDTGCEAIDTVIVEMPDELTSTLDQVQDATTGQDNGFIRISVAGGTPPYDYVWSNGGTTQDIFNLSPGVYTVTIRDANGCETGRQVEVFESVSIEEQEEFTFTLYPNPASEAVNITWEAWSPTSLKVFDNLGNLVEQRDIAKVNMNQLRIDISNLPNAIYTVQLEDGERVLNQRFIKQ